MVFTSVGILPHVMRENLSRSDGTFASCSVRFREFGSILFGRSARQIRGL